MCEVLDRIEKKGRAEGRVEGRMKEKKETAINLRNMGMDVEFIAKAISTPAATVKQWLSQA